MTLFSSLGDGYVRRALLEVVIVGVLCGAVGVHVVLRRLSFLTMALTHATFPGVVIATLLGLGLVLGAGLFGVLLVAVVAVLTGPRGAEHGRETTSVTAVVLSGGFALGMALMSTQDGFSRDLTAFLVGSVLTVQPSDLVVSAVTAVVVLGVLVALRKELFLAAFDPDALAAAGYPARRLDLVLLLALEATVVTSLPAVGTIMAVALIVGPAATARLWCSRTSTMTAAAIVIGVASGVIGLAVSEQWNVAAGGAIVLSVAAFFVVSLVLRSLPWGEPGVAAAARRKSTGRPTYSG
ncbi:metal ABC transporter permease [Frankia sp. QA3]|uniref:metal ABC transporter permease n=1 Tax=Frankia sp. QA3 TaxID=710111 RepID=UPI000269C950|nr:metal ABC transporter permease [Frankia sp. QA3]EIV95003.1 ABC-type Mn2+/Zn2+ transport system, permease component [Frankia sp. QA3]